MDKKIIIDIIVGVAVGIFLNIYSYFKHKNRKVNIEYIEKLEAEIADLKKQLEGK